MGKFKIPNIPQTEQKTIRFPINIIEEIEKLIKGRECTFSAFVIAAVKNAIEDLKKNKI